MKTRRQGQTGAASAASRIRHACRLLAVLLEVCRQLRRAQRDSEARQAYRAVERDLAGLIRRRRSEQSARGKPT